MLGKAIANQIKIIIKHREHSC